MEHKIKKVQNMSLHVLRSCQIDTPILAFEETSRVQKSQKMTNRRLRFLYIISENVEQKRQYVLLFYTSFIYPIPLRIKVNRYI